MPAQTSVRPRRVSVRPLLTRPVDGASLALLRVVYGAVGVLSAVRLLAYGWVDERYSAPSRHFTYFGFGWVRPPGATGMVVLVLVMGASAAAVAVGWHYRAAMVSFWLSFTWIELIDVTTYLNHYWFVSAAGLVMIVAPMASTWSLDARRGGRSRPVPIGVVWLFRFQVAVVYAFAGLAKLNADWLVHGTPLRLWLPAREAMVIVGPWLGLPATAVALSWAGAVFDCSVVPLLLWRRTRPWAWGAVVAFHVSTWVLFPIGVFPWLMIGATTIFFAPDWPRAFVGRLARRWRPAVTPPGRPSPPGATATATRPVRSIRPLWLALAAVWIVVQVALPLRHHLYPGDARWTGEGYRFAWNVLLTEKAGSVSFAVLDIDTGRTSVESALDLYTPAQWQVMATEPELIRQAAHAIAEEHAAAGQRVEVRADAHLSLNGRPARRLIDPTVDLAAEPARLTPQPWILRDEAP